MSIETSKKQIEDLLLKYYHKGHELSDGELYRPMLHDNFSFFWINNKNKIEITDKEDYISWYYDGLKNLDRNLITLKFLSYEKIKTKIHS